MDDGFISTTYQSFGVMMDCAESGGKELALTIADIAGLKAG